jgi:hypothetical protein
MNIKLIAELAGVLIATGVVLGIIAVVGTSRPPRPSTPSQRWAARLWRGEGLGARECRSRQTLLVVGTTVVRSPGWSLACR